jgi:hypothetical protein
VVLPHEIFSSSITGAEDARETEALSISDRFQAGEQKTLVTYP